MEGLIEDLQYKHITVIYYQRSSSYRRNFIQDFFAIYIIPTLLLLR